METESFFLKFFSVTILKKSENNYLIILGGFYLSIDLRLISVSKTGAVRDWKGLSWQVRPCCLHGFWDKTPDAQVRDRLRARRKRELMSAWATALGSHKRWAPWPGSTPRALTAQGPGLTGSTQACRQHLAHLCLGGRNCPLCSGQQTPLPSACRHCLASQSHRWKPTKKLPVRWRRAARRWPGICGEFRQSPLCCKYILNVVSVI